MINQGIKEICDGLKSCLEQKKLLMTEILEITEKQKKDIEKDGGENLNALLDERQEKMDEVDKLDELFLKDISAIKAELRVNDLGLVSGKDYPELASLKPVIQEVQDIVNRTLILEKEAEAGLKSLMDGVRKEMLMAQKGRRTVNAYESNPKSNDGYFVDQKK